MKSKFLTLLLVLIIPIIFSLLAFKTLGDYGINWDEPYHFRRGQAFLQFYLTGKKTYQGIPKYPALKGTADSPGFRNSEAHFQEIQKNPSLSDPNFRRSYYQDDDWNGEYHIDQEDPYGHSAFNGIMAALFNKIFYQKLGILGDLESYHLFEIIISAFLIFFVAIFMWKEFGIIESIVSSLALATYPLFLGEQHFNIKDPIESTFYTITLLSAYKTIVNKSPLWLIITSITFAIGLSVKFNIIFIIFPIAAWAIIYFIKNKITFKFSKKFYLTVIISPLIILSLFVFFYPTIWKNIPWGIGRIVSYYLIEGYAQSQPSKYYLLNFINTYPIIWIFYTTPIITLLLFINSLAFFKNFLKNRMFPLLLIFSLITTIGRISLFKALSYGGVRLIMEYVPIFAILCGIGAGYLYKRIKKIHLYIFITIIVIAYSPTIIKLIKIHPNENVYFNSLIGGLKGAKERQVNAWGNSNGNAYFPALLWLNTNAEKNAKLTIPVGSSSNIPRFKLRSDIALSADYWSGPEHKGEYVLELTYDYQQMNWYSLSYLNSVMQPLFEVKVDGVPIAKVWKNSLEFVRPEYKNQKLVTGIINNNKKQYLEIILPKTEKLMQITLIQPTENCKQVSTGYIETSIDGKMWTREIEDIARDQLKHAALKDLDTEFNFYFTAKEAKIVRFYSENKDICLFGSTKATFTVLDGN